MHDYETARKAMVDSQIHTMGVVNDAVLEAFRTVQREKFAPESRKAVAYCDEDLQVANGRYLMEPVTHARLMQAALPQAGDNILDIGGATGYSAAVFANLAARVVAVEADSALLGLAQANWRETGFDSAIIPHQGTFADGCTSYGPYSLIFLNGSVAEIPFSLLDQLAPNGRLVAVVKKAEDKIGKAMLISKSDSGIVGERVLFDAAVPYLPGMEPATGFIF